MRHTVPLLVLGLLFATKTPARGQARLDLQLTLPSSSQEALTSRTGLTWDALRRNGLVLRHRGSGETALVMFVLAVRDGRIVDRWSSASFTVSGSGTRTITSRFIPGDQFAGGPGPIHAMEPSRSGIDASAVLEGIEAGTVRWTDLGRDGSLVFVVLPGGSGQTAATNPLFAKSVEMDDL